MSIGATKALMNELAVTSRAWYQINRKLDGRYDLSPSDKSRYVYECQRLERHLNNLIEAFNKVRISSTKNS